MPNTTVPAYAYWAVQPYFHSMTDPQGTADVVALFGVLGALVLLAIIGFRFWAFRRKQARLQRWHGWMVRKLDEFKQARRVGREHELDDLTFSAADIQETETELRHGRRVGHYYTAAFTVLGLFLALCIWMIVTCWGQWWLEGGYQCTDAVPGQIVTNQLDPEGLQQTMLGGRVNVCALGMFTHPLTSVGNLKMFIRETLY